MREDMHQELDKIEKAISLLERIVDVHSGNEDCPRQMKEEKQKIHADYLRATKALQQSELRANRLEEVNREVSRRLVTTMETIRAVLDR
ncbi:DUF4164 family protein [Candidatus Liberibacter sp.]|uniref:DUF4164 family protein n=1 Tax=Candidatus Liberibacter sp. TaxID=34022 RepID=UPI0015F61CC8|nr:DUF4164 family protein [Candidatus Liberibacter sp.]MBA5723648.1 DUF4164 domain-containing protein [Candidatus Liberibacter sp.]